LAARVALNREHLFSREGETSAKRGIRPSSSVMLNLFQHPMLLKDNDMNHA
jgi:hypothetical protein